MNVIIIVLTVAIGSTMAADSFLTLSTIEIVGLGLLAFFSARFGRARRQDPEPVPDGKDPTRCWARLASPRCQSRPGSATTWRSEYDKDNFLIYHAMGPNLAGVFGTAISGGIMLALSASSDEARRSHRPHGGAAPATCRRWVQA